MTRKIQDGFEEMQEGLTRIVSAELYLTDKLIIDFPRC